MRAQLHALAGILNNLDARSPDARRREGVAKELQQAMKRGDERRVIALMRDLAAIDRAGVHDVDWTKASGG